MKCFLFAYKKLIDSDRLTHITDGAWTDYLDKVIGQHQLPQAFISMISAQINLCMNSGNHAKAMAIWAVKHWQLTCLIKREQFSPPARFELTKPTSSRWQTKTQMSSISHET